MPLQFASLSERGVVSVRGADAEHLLQGVITNDMLRLGATAAIHAALLMPQGKILVDFFVIRHGDGFLLDVARSRVDELVRRLSMYRLRARAEIVDVSAGHTVGALMGGAIRPLTVAIDGCFPDPRHPDLAVRMIRPAGSDPGAGPGVPAAAIECFGVVDGHDPRPDSAPAVLPVGDDAYHARRVALGVPEGGYDWAFGDTFPHESNFDLLHGVSFSKGCYVGQEVVARMQHKAVVRKRVVRVTARQPLTQLLTTGADIRFRELSVGRVGTVAGNEALAMVRLDRADEAEAAGRPLLADGVELMVDPAALDRFRREVRDKPPEPVLPR